MCVCIVEETLHLVARKPNLDSAGAVKCCLPSRIMGISGEWRGGKSQEALCGLLFFKFCQKKR